MPLEPLDQRTLDLVSAHLHDRANAELLMRDLARKDVRQEIANMHGDRASAYDEASRVVAGLTIEKLTDGGWNVSSR